MGTWIPDYQYEVMRWVGQMRGVDYLLLRYLLARNRTEVPKGILSKPKTSQAIKKWVAHGLVKKEVINGDTWIWLTRKGLREVGLSYPARKPSWFHIDHTRGLTRIRFYLENRYGSKIVQFITEREIDSQFQKLPKEKQIATKKVDLIFYLDGHPIALEYERTVMTREDILKLYDQYNGAWLVGTDATVPKLEKVIEGYEDYFDVIHESRFTLEA